MTPELMAQCITLSLLFVAMGMQIRNMVKYGLKNGAGRTRMLLLMALAAYIIHTLRIMNGFSQGYFFTVGVFCLLVLYFRLPEQSK